MLKEHSRVGHRHDRGHRGVLSRRQAVRAGLPSAWAKGEAVNIEAVVLLAICGFLLAYLTFALLRPEKF
jgi:K+-transporting ATPase KdpF subunit